MEKEFIPYEQALALKELGFDEQCLALYDLDGKITIEFVNWKNAKNRKSNYLIATPLYQQAFRWFREKYNIDSSINKQQHINKYCVSLDLTGFYADDDLFPEEFTLFNTYEYAELELLKKLIEIIKNK